MYSTRPSGIPAWSKLKIASIGIISGTVLLYNPLKNSVFIDYFVKKSSLISADQKIVTLPEDLHQFCDDIRNEVRIKEKSKGAVKFFLTKELDVTSIGNLNLYAGAKVGIPYTFTFEKVEDADPKVISSLIGEKKLTKSDWHRTEKGQKLIDSLILSKEARKFAIARGIMAADSESIIYKDFLNLATVFSAVASYEFLEPRTTSMIGKVPSIVLLVTMIMVVSVAFSIAGHEALCQYCTQVDDGRVIQNPKEDYKKGATEFYEKLIERNKSLRGLLTDGPEKFDSDGNPISWYQINFSSLKSRLDNCKQVIDTWKDDTRTL